jgi:hypothetical protein
MEIESDAAAIEHHIQILRVAIHAPTPFRRNHRTYVWSELGTPGVGKHQFVCGVAGEIIDFDVLGSLRDDRGGKLAGGLFAGKQKRESASGNDEAQSRHSECSRRNQASR